MNRPYARFFAAVRKASPGGASDAELRATLVSQFTSGRTDSLRDMEPAEYDALCRFLEGGTATVRQPSTPELRKYRSQALHQLQLLGIDTASWDRVNAFCLDPRIAGRPFAALDVIALRALVVKLRALRRKEGRLPPPQAAAKPQAPIIPLAV